MYNKLKFGFKNNLIGHAEVYQARWKKEFFPLAKRFNNDAIR